MAHKVITGRVTLSYPSFKEARAPAQGGEPKFGGAFVFESLDATKELQAAAKAAGEEYFGEKKFKQLVASGALQITGGKGAAIRTDGMAKGYGEGTVYINARSKSRPGLVYGHAGPDGKPAPVPESRIEDDLYAGAAVRVSVNAYAYDKAGNQGIGWGLNNVQKLGDGPRLDGRMAASEEFEVDPNAKAFDLSDLEGEE